MNEKKLFGQKSHCNCKYNQLQVLELLLMFPCFMVRNVYGYATSSLHVFLDCHKDVFYRFLSRDDADWRKILMYITKQLWSTVEKKSERDTKDSPVCLMVDDTDFPKRGLHTELIGKVFSHCKHAMILGFKALFMCITDGRSQMILDYSIVGEEGKAKKQGMTVQQLEGRFTKERDECSATKMREKEYKTSKIDLMIDMISRAVNNRIKFDYILADSWFACSKVIHFVSSLKIGCHYLGMIKIGKKGVTTYSYQGQSLSAPVIISKLVKDKKVKRCRQLKCRYGIADVVYDGEHVRLFFVRHNGNGDWKGLITTDMKLTFLKAYKIYSMRWSIEVIFKDCKLHLGLGKYQQQNFASQIAGTAITSLQYNILSVSKRFSDYETIGGLFSAAKDDTMELSVTERLWQVIIELVDQIADLFSTDIESIFDTLINRTDKVNYFVDFYQLKMSN